LITNYNDWFPGGVDVPDRLRGLVTARFQRLCRESAAALCFSPGIRQAAGGGEHAFVLYPIPEDQPLPTGVPIAPHALFAGRFDHFLGPEMNSLVRALRERDRTSLLRIIGPSATWSGETRGLIEGTSIYGGLLKDEPFRRALAAASVHLVLAPFGSESEHIARYSFASKIPEYCRYGRPIIVWGPEYCQAVQWARRTGAAFAVTDSDPDRLIARIEGLVARPKEGAPCIAAALREARTTFDPASLQGVFNGAVERALSFGARGSSR
jgi:hypothetical protein